MSEIDMDRKRKIDRENGKGGREGEWDREIMWGDV